MKFLVTILTLITTLFFGINEISLSQNLVNNPSFESFHSCPNSHSQLDSVLGWNNPTQANPDYYHTCAGANCVNCVPANFNGFQAPKCGNGYIGLFTYHPPNSYRGYAQSRLTKALDSGKQYLVSFDVSLGDNHSNAVSELGLHFSKTPITRSDYFPLSQFTPQVQNSMPFFLEDKDNWNTINGVYIASGGEQYITIGNFLPDSLTHVKSLPTGTDTRAYYFIDNVKVIESGLPCVSEIKDSLTICAGDSVFILGEFQSSPGLYLDSVLGSGSCCDFVFAFNLEVRGWDTVSETLNFKLCPNDSVLLKAGWIKQPGVFTESIPNHNTCIINKTIYRIEPQDWNWTNEYDTVYICKGDSILLNGNYEKENGDFLDTITLRETCKKIVLTTSLNVSKHGLTQVPQIFLGCTGHSTFVSATSEGATYLWDNGSRDSITSYEGKGKHWVRRKIGICTRTDTFEIFKVDPSDLTLGRDTSICPGDTILLKTNFPGNKFRWSTGEIGPEIKINRPGQYWTEMIEPSCYSFARISVFENQNCGYSLVLPNLITPNGDGLNDRLIPIEANGITKLETKIFNRWGNIVGESNSVQIDWDSKDLPTGVYFYQVKIWGFGRYYGVKSGSLKILR